MYIFLIEFSIVHTSLILD